MSIPSPGIALSGLRTTLKLCGVFAGLALLSFTLSLDVSADPIPIPPQRNWTTDGVSAPDSAPWPTNSVHQTLGYWLFDSDDVSSPLSDSPWWATNLVRVAAAHGMALRIHSEIPAAIRFAVRQSNTNGDFSVRQGSAAFWFRPGWSSGSPAAPLSGTPLLEVGANSPERVGWWALQLMSGGSQLQFVTQAGGEEQTLFQAPYSFSANLWTHVALTWTPTNSALFLQGQRIASGPGVTRWPQFPERERWGWGLGGDGAGVRQAKGDFDDLVTMNYPLSAEAIQRLANPTSSSTPTDWQMSLAAVELAAEDEGNPTGLWLQAVTLSATESRSAWLHGTTVGQTYELFGAETLAGPWRLELSLVGTATRTAIELPDDARTSLFLMAADYVDQDGDGLSNEYELRVSKTSATAADSDQDGMPDGWELQHALNPNLKDDSLDPDGDGFSNGLEYHLGRNPRTLDILPAISVSASKVVVAENSTGMQFLIKRTGPVDRELSIHFELRGAADNGHDYVWIQKKVILPVGATQVAVAIEPIDDGLDERQETVELELAPGGEYLLGTPNTAVVTLTDNDLPIVEVAALDPIAREPQFSWTNPGQFEIRRDGLLDQPLTVALTASGSVVLATDLQSFPTSVTIPAAQRATTIAVNPKNNGALTGDRTLTVAIKPNSTLYQVSSDYAQASIAIQDAQPPVVTLVASDPDAGETVAGKANPGAFKFVRSGGTGKSLTVYYRVGGTATASTSGYARADYGALPGMVVIPTGKSEQVVPVTVIDSTDSETLETVTAVLAGSLDYAIGNPSEATVNIDDNTVPAISSTTLAACSGRGGGPNAYIEVIRTGSTANPLTVPIEVEGRRYWNNVWYDFKNVPVSAGASYGLFVDSQPVTSVTFPKGVFRRVLTVKAMHAASIVPTASVIVNSSSVARRLHPVQFIDPEDQVRMSVGTTDLVEGLAWSVVLTPGSATSGPDGTTVKLTLSGEAELKDYTVTGGTLIGNELTVHIPPTVSGSNKRQVTLKLTPKLDGIVEKTSEHLVVQFDQRQTGAALDVSQQAAPYVAGRIRDSVNAPVYTLDVDGDQLPDSFEIATGTDPLKTTEFLRDFDRDGLSDREELIRGTKYDQADTDGDGVNDLIETLLGLDPLVKDAVGIAPWDELIPIRLRTAGQFREANNACYRCHAPGMEVGHVTLSPTTTRPGTESGGILDQVFLFRSGSYPIHLIPPADFAPTGKDEIYDAEILPARAETPGFITLDHADPLLGKSKKYNSTTFTRSATLRVLRPPRLAVDADRDGVIRFDSSDATTAERPYRFWVNNDDDAASDESDLDNLDDDNADMLIKNPRDLEDFSRIWIDLDGVTDLVANGTLELGLEWRNLASGAPTIQLFPAYEADGGRQYLFDPTIAAQQSLPNAQLPYYATSFADRTALNRIVGKNGRFILRSADAKPPGASKRLLLLFEGIGSGKGELVVVLLRNGSVVSESAPLHLHLMDVRSLYHLGEGVPTEGFALPYHSPTAEPTIPRLTFVNQKPIPNPLEEPRAIVFVHGWNMTREESLTFADTMYKRLWHAGFKGRFGTFRWPTHVLSAVPPTDPMSWQSFNLSEHRAWHYGAVLKSFLASLPAGYQRSAVAHSMGAIVLASALNLAADCDNAVFMQGALSAGFFDASTALDEPRLIAAEAEAQHPYRTPDHFSTERGYRGGFRGFGVKHYNYFNADDFALQTGGYLLNVYEVNWVNNQIQERPHDKGVADGFAYSWQSSEQLNPALNRSWFYKGGLDPMYGRIVKDQAEIWAFCARSRTRALGAEGRTRGPFTANTIQDLAQWDFIDTRSDHSGQFNRTVQQTVGLYAKLLLDLAAD